MDIMITVRESVSHVWLLYQAIYSEFLFSFVLLLLSSSLIFIIFGTNEGSTGGSLSDNQ